MSFGFTRHIGSSSYLEVIGQPPSDRGLLTLQGLRFAHGQGRGTLVNSARPDNRSPGFQGRASTAIFSAAPPRRRSSSELRFHVWPACEDSRLASCAAGPSRLVSTTGFQGAWDLSICSLRDRVFFWQGGSLGLGASALTKVILSLWGATLLETTSHHFPKERPNTTKTTNYSPLREPGGALEVRGFASQWRTS